MECPFSASKQLDFTSSLKGPSQHSNDWSAALLLFFNNFFLVFCFPADDLNIQQVRIIMIRASKEWKLEIHFLFLYFCALPILLHSWSTFCNFVVIASKTFKTTNRYQLNWDLLLFNYSKKNKLLREVQSLWNENISTRKWQHDL